MGQKTKFGFVFCAAAGLIASAGLSYADAQAQQGDVEPISVPEPEASADPVFISDEVVQPLPEPEETPAVVEAVVPDADSLSELMANVDAPQTLSDQLECLAGAIYFESRGEPLDGQLAVAQVIVNRAEDRRFPSSYCGVVFQRSQFSFVKGGSMPRIRTGSGAWKRAQAIARIAHRGLWDSRASDALYFHANYVRPKWSRRKVALATIDTHVFYR